MEKEKLKETIRSLREQLHEKTGSKPETADAGIQTDNPDHKVAEYIPTMKAKYEEENDRESLLALMKTRWPEEEFHFTEFAEGLPHPSDNSPLIIAVAGNKMEGKAYNWAEVRYPELREMSQVGITHAVRTSVDANGNKKSLTIIRLLIDGKNEEHWMKALRHLSRYIKQLVKDPHKWGKLRLAKVQDMDNMKTSNEGVEDQNHNLGTQEQSAQNPNGETGEGKATSKRGTHY